MSNTPENKPRKEIDEQAYLQRLRIEIKAKHEELHLLQRPSLLVISALMALFVLSDMLIVTPCVELTLNKICEGLCSNKKNCVCDPVRVQTVLSDITSLTGVLTGLINMVVAGKLGELSDSFGRVRVLAVMGIIKTLGTVFKVACLTPYVPYSKALIIFSEIPAAFTGGTFATIGIANSYISDVVEPEDRTFCMSILMSVLFGTVGAGPLLSSLMVKLSRGNNMIPVYIAVAFGVIFTALCCTVVKEPRHEDALLFTRQKLEDRYRERMRSYSSKLSRSTSFSERLGHHARYQTVRMLEPLAPIRHFWMKRTEAGSTLPRRNVLILIIIDILAICGTTALMPSIVLFTTYVYNWRSVELGYFVSFSGIVNAIMLSLVSPVIFRFLKEKCNFTALKYSVDKVDIFVIKASMIFISLGLLAFILENRHPLALFGYVILKSAGAVCSPTIQSSIVKYHGSNTGQLFGAIALVDSLANLVVPPIMLWVYRQTLSYRPEAFLYISLAACVLGWLMSYFLRVDINAGDDEQVCVFDNEDGETDTTPSDITRLLGQENLFEQGNRNPRYTRYETNAV